MTKYKLLKPIKNVVWDVGEVMEMEGIYGNDYLKYKHVGYTTCMNMYPPVLALLEHAGFIEEVDETPKRWRAMEEGYYFYLDEHFEIRDTEDDYFSFDDTRYETGNYFQTKKQVEEFQKGVKALTLTLTINKTK